MGTVSVVPFPVPAKTIVDVVRGVSLPGLYWLLTKVTARLLFGRDLFFGNAPGAFSKAPGIGLVLVYLNFFLVFGMGQGHVNTLHVLILFYKCCIRPRYKVADWTPSKLSPSKPIAVLQD